MNMDKNNASDLASLDCWDYTIELECLRGPQGTSSLSLDVYGKIRIHRDSFLYLKAYWLSNYE